MDNFLIAKATDVGITRQLNEDCMSVFESPNGHVLAVCDGMGGQAAGDLASELAISVIENILTDNTFATPEEAIRQSVMAANQAVLNKTAQNPELEGMGSTCVMLIIKNGRVHGGWVGDSRIYYISNHTIRQISHDQSYVQQLVDSGQISEAEAANHPQRNEITNCIGLEGMTPPDTIAVPIAPEPGSIFLLCSDGLSGMVSDAQIERLLSNRGMTLQQKADRLIAMANEAGGLDNITVELVQFAAGEETVIPAQSAAAASEIPAPKPVAKKSRTWLYALIALLIISLGTGGYLYWSHQQDQKKKETKTEKKEAPRQTPTRAVAPAPSPTPAPKVVTPQAPSQKVEKAKNDKKPFNPKDAFDKERNNPKKNNLIDKVTEKKNEETNTKKEDSEPVTVINGSKEKDGKISSR